MDNSKLEKALKLKKEIEEIEEFLEYMLDVDLKGEMAVKKPKFLFKYKSWRNKEKSFSFNERLTFNILLQVEKELDDLKLQYEAL